MPDWSIEQLDGDKTVLWLGGWMAPFGRPRRKAVLTETFTQRVQTVRYPGALSPTRHLLGWHWEDFELNGRWMTRLMPTDATANEMADSIIKLVQDGRRCRISWGNIVSYVGIIEKIELARESPDEIAWKMKFLVDYRPELKWKFQQTDRVDISTEKDKLIEQFNGAWIRFGSKELEKTIPDWNPDFFDQIDGLFSNINGLSANFVNLVNQFDNLASATKTELSRALATIHQMRTAVATLSETLSTLPMGISSTVSQNTNIQAAPGIRPDALDFLFTRDADSDTNFQGWYTQSTIARDEVLTVLADIERTILIQKLGQALRSYTARDGDTWESISILMFGLPDKAESIRLLNGVRGGELPVSGQTYKIPK